MFGEVGVLWLAALESSGLIQTKLRRKTVQKPYCRHNARAQRGNYASDNRRQVSNATFRNVLDALVKCPRHCSELVIRCELQKNSRRMVVRLQNNYRILSLFTLCVFCEICAGAGDSWPRWRGPQDAGSTGDGNYCINWSAEKIRWKVELPGKGCSTPIVWGKNIYVTSPIDGMNGVLAFDWEGKSLWQVKLGKENAGKHRNGSGSNPSPATDGTNLLVYFKSGDLASLDFSGRVHWQTNLVASYGPDNLYWDHGASPVLSGTDVIITRMHHGDSWIAAFNKRTGQLHWKVPRNYDTPVEGDHGYGTPITVSNHGKEALLVWGALHLTLHDAADGQLIWSSIAAFNPESRPNWPTVASLVVCKDVAVIPFGRADRGLPRLHGISLGSNETMTSGGKEIWRRNDFGSFVPTPVAYKGRVYVVRDRGEIDCIDPVAGKTIWSGAFPKASANFYSSPVIAGGKLYAAREDGVVFVASTDDKFEILAENQMSEHVIASITPCSGRLLIRGEQHLFCIGED